MIGYALLGSNDMERARAFYDALFGTIGVGRLMEFPTGATAWGANWTTPMLGITPPYDGQPATAGNGTMGGFSFDSRDEVAAFHAKALELGGTCEGEPGERMGGSWFAYFRDLDGNKLCGFTFGKG